MKRQYLLWGVIALFITGVASLIFPSEILAQDGGSRGDNSGGYVYEYTEEFSDNSLITVNFNPIQLQAGDTLYVEAETTAGDLIPNLAVQSTSEQDIFAFTQLRVDDGLESSLVYLAEDDIEVDVVVYDFNHGGNFRVFIGVNDRSGLSANSDPANNTLNLSSDANDAAYQVVDESTANCDAPVYVSPGVGLSEFSDQNTQTFISQLTPDNPIQEFYLPVVPALNTVSAYVTGICSGLEPIIELVDERSGEVFLRSQNYTTVTNAALAYVALEEFDFFLRVRTNEGQYGAFEITLSTSTDDLIRVMNGEHFPVGGDEIVTLVEVEPTSDVASDTTSDENDETPSDDTSEVAAPPTDGNPESITCEEPVNEPPTIGDGATVADFDSQPSQTFAGELPVAYGFQYYNVPNLRSGDVLFVYVDSSCGGIDTVIELINEQTGETVAYNDDFYSIDNSALEYEIPNGGNYGLIVYSYNGESAGKYLVTIGVNQPDVLVPGAAGLGDSTLAYYNPTRSQGVRATNAIQGFDDFFSNDTFIPKRYTLLDLQQDDQLTIYATRNGSRSDPYIRLLDENFNILAQDDDSGGGLDAFLQYNIPARGQYFIEVLSCCGIEDELDTEAQSFRLWMALNEDVASPLFFDNLNPEANTTGIITSTTELSENKTLAPSNVFTASAEMNTSSVHYYKIDVDDLEAGDILHASVETIGGNGTPEMKVYLVDLNANNLGEVIEDDRAGVAATVRDGNRKAKGIDVSISSPTFTAIIEVRMVPSNPDASITQGTYRLRVGVNRPDILTGRPNSELEVNRTILGKVIDEFSSTSVPRVEVIEGVLELNNRDTFSNEIVDALEDVTLTDVGAGDEISAYLEFDNDNIDYAGMLISVNVVEYDPIQNNLSEVYESGTPLALSYRLNGASSQAKISYYVQTTVDAVEDGELAVDTVPYRLVIGINDPTVVLGETNVTPVPVFPVETATEVDVSMELVQITDVNQKEENFTVVTELFASWQDADLIFHPADNDGDPVRQFTSVDSFLESYPDFAWPAFLVPNQQGEAFLQTQLITLQTDGRIEFRERQTITLQAPDFDFRSFPFDDQVFNIRVQTIFPEDQIVLNAQNGIIGEQLGEEEWQVVGSGVASQSVDGYSEFVLRLDVERQRNFYLYRIIIPLLAIIGMGLAIMFLHDYELRVGASSANLLLFIAFNFTIGDDLPRLGYLTFMDWLLLIGFVVAALVFALDVYLFRLHENNQEKRAERISNMARFAYVLIYAVAGIWLYTQFFV